METFSGYIILDIAGFLNFRRITDQNQIIRRMDSKAKGNSWKFKVYVS
jgi:hypothetical protein